MKATGVRTADYLGRLCGGWRITGRGSRVESGLAGSDLPDLTGIDESDRGLLRRGGSMLQPSIDREFLTI